MIWMLASILLISGQVDASKKPCDDDKPSLGSLNIPKLTAAILSVGPSDSSYSKKSSKERSTQEGVHTPWNKTRCISSDQNSPVLYTDGLTPCTAVLFVATNPQGERMACLAHVAYFSGVHLGRSRHEISTRELFDEIRQEMDKRGFIFSSSKVTLNGWLNPDDKIDSQNFQGTDTQNSMLASQLNTKGIETVLLNYGFNEIEKIFSPEIQVREIRYNLKTNEILVTEDQQKK